MVNTTNLKGPKSGFVPITPARFDNRKSVEGLSRSIRRAVNFFYHCNAVADIKLNIEVP